MPALSSPGSRAALALTFALGAGVAAPMACLFPSYDFDLPPGAGGATSSGTRSTTTTSTSSGMGGMPATSTTGVAGGTTSSSSTGMPCASQDCSDPTCAGSFTCVPSTPPMGWTGYFALFDGKASQFTGCPTEFPSTGYSGNDQISVPPANCNCNCGTPTNEKCEIAGPMDSDQQAQMILPGAIDAILVVDAPCNGNSICAGPLLEVPTWPGTCDGPNYFTKASTCQPGAGQDCTMGSAPCAQAMQANALAVTGGSCTANAGTPTFPPVSWGTLGQACGGGMPGTGCSDPNDACMPIPQGIFHSGVCIMQTGDVGCSGQFSEKHTFYGGATMNGRSCSTCGCDPPTGATCSATITVYSNSGGNVCNGSAIATLHPTTQSGDCVDLQNNPEVGSKQATFTINTAGTCASNAQSMGTETPINPTTFCCIP